MKRLLVTLVVLPSYFLFAQNAKIKIDIERSIGEIDPRIYGTADIVNTSGTFSGKAQASIINSDSLKEQFSFDKQSQYAPVIKEVSADNNKITYSFPPHSFTQMKITIKKN